MNKKALFWLSVFVLIIVVGYTVAVTFFSSVSLGFGTARCETAGEFLATINCSGFWGSSLLELLLTPISLILFLWFMTISTVIFFPYQIIQAVF